VEVAVEMETVEMVVQAVAQAALNLVQQVGQATRLS